MCLLLNISIGAFFSVLHLHSGQMGQRKLLTQLKQLTLKLKLNVTFVYLLIMCICFGKWALLHLGDQY